VDALNFLSNHLYQTGLFKVFDMALYRPNRALRVMRDTSDGWPADAFVIRMVRQFQ